MKKSSKKEQSANSKTIQFHNWGLIIAVFLFFIAVIVAYFPATRNFGFLFAFLSVMYFYEYIVYRASIYKAEKDSREALRCPRPREVVEDDDDEILKEDLKNERNH